MSSCLLARPTIAWLGGGSSYNFHPTCFIFRAVPSGNWEGTLNSNRKNVPTMPTRNVHIGRSAAAISHFSGGLRREHDQTQNNRWTVRHTILCDHHSRRQEKSITIHCHHHSTTRELGRTMATTITDWDDDSEDGMESLYRDHRRGTSFMCWTACQIQFTILFPSSFHVDTTNDLRGVRSRRAATTTLPRSKSYTFPTHDGPTAMPFPRTRITPITIHISDV